MSKWETCGPSPRELRIVFEGREYRTRTVNDMFRLIDQTKYIHSERWLPGIEEEIWRTLKEAYPMHIHEIPAPPPASVGITSALSFVRFMIKQGFTKQTVEPAEAERRAAICRQCPMGRAVPACVICKQGLRLLVSPPYAVQAPEGCAACGCYLPLKVWVPREHLGAAQEFPFDASCWMHEEAPPALVQEPPTPE